MTDIRFDKVSFKYSPDVEALSNVSLHINDGEVIGLMGKNGAGKSTLIQLMNGLLIPSKGEVFVNGTSTEKADPHKLMQKIGIMFQNPEHQLFSNSVEEELNFSLNNLAIKKEEKLRYKQEIIEELGLQELLQKSPWNCSGGERKKISIACILCRKPEILVFDEPTLGQDKYGYTMLEEVIEKAKKRNQTIIVVTHNTEFAFHHLERIIVLDQGKILADGPTEKILNNSFILQNSALVIPHLYKFINEITEDPTVPRELARIVTKAKSFKELEMSLQGYFGGNESL